MTGTDHRVVFSREGNFLSEKSVIALARMPHQLMIVSTRGEKLLIKGVHVTLGKTGRRLIADKITGTLYDPETGRCLSSDARTLEGPAPEGYKLPPKGEAFCFGTQPITSSPKAVPKKRGRPQKQGAERNADGKGCGSSKSSAAESASGLVRVTWWHLRLPASAARAIAPSRWAAGSSAPS